MCIRNILIGVAELVLFRMILSLKSHVGWSPPSAIPKEIEPNRSSINYTYIAHKRLQKRRTIS